MEEGVGIINNSTWF